METKKIILFLLVLIAILAFVFIIRTITYRFGNTANDSSDKEAVNTQPSEKAIHRFAGGIRIPTISNESYNQTNFKPFDEFKEYLAQAYPEVYRVMETDSINTYGLVFHWKGKDSSLKPILFLSHYDVVPVIGYDPATMDTSDTVFQINDKPIPPIQSI